MNDVWRARVTSSSKAKCASLVKICRSGQNRTRVPVTPFLTRPILVRPDCSAEVAIGAGAVERARGAALKRHRPRGRSPVDLDVEARGERVDDRGADPVEATGRDVRAAAELAARVQPRVDDLDPGRDRSSARCRPGCRGRRRATLGRSVRRTASRRIVVQKPASASSTPLSMTSHRHCISPRVSVDPMYIPGRFRTASSPSRTRR